MARIVVLAFAFIGLAHVLIELFGPAPRPRVEIRDTVIINIGTGYADADHADAARPLDARP